MACKKKNRTIRACAREEVLMLERMMLFGTRRFGGSVYAVEFWKALKIHLRETAGVDAATPKRLFMRRGRPMCHS